MDQFVKELAKLFPIKDLGEASFYMGCHIHRVREAREIYIGQHLCIESLVNRYDISMESELPALVDRHSVLSKEDIPQSPEEREVMKGIPYREEDFYGRR